MSKAKQDEACSDSERRLRENKKMDLTMFISNPSVLTGLAVASLLSLLVEREARQRATENQRAVSVELKLCRTCGRLS